MKTLQLLAVIIFGFTATSISQNCIPNAPVTVGYYPPSDSISCAFNGIYYDNIISYKGHPNSVYTAYVDSIRNLPLGLSANYTTNALLPGGSWCARITGMPNATCGQYKVLVYIRIPQVGLQGELSQLSNAYPAFFFATDGDNNNRIIRVSNNLCQSIIKPQINNFLATSCGISTTPGNMGINIDNPQYNLHIKDLMKLEPRDAAPLNPTKGVIYFDNILNKMRVYDGAAWQNCW